MGKKLFIAGLGISTLIGLAARILAIGSPLPGVDEVMALYFAKFSPGSLWFRLYESETHPPGFYWLLHTWISLIGFNYLEVTSRSLRNLWWINLIPYLATVASLVWLSQQLKLRRGITLLLVFLFCTNLFHIAAGIELRTYPWLSVTLLLSSGFALRGNLTRWALVSAAAFYFHYFALFPITAQAVFIARSHRQQPARKIFLSRVGLLALLALPALLIMANPTKLRNHHPLEHTYTVTPAGVGTLIGDAFMPAITTPPLAWIGFGLFLVLALGVTQHRRERALFLLMLCLPLSFLLLLGVFGKNLYLARYFLVFHFSLLLLLAIAFDGVLSSIRRWPVSAAGILLIGLCLYDSATHLSRIQLALPIPARIGWRQMAHTGYEPRLRSALCSGKAQTSNDYVAAELLFYYCPEIFLSLSHLSTQIVFPSTEWRNTREPPEALIHLNDIPSRRLYSNAETFFRRVSKFTESRYIKINQAHYTIWLLERRAQVVRATEVGVFRANGQAIGPGGPRMCMTEYTVTK